ncbi:hypothetical protein [Streptomyces cuspidosporus]|uniref:hypothetical protein n=1 Tax=Streptomyces cuspidosporus TaxID=66882 RepID=UPI0031FC8193
MRQHLDAGWKQLADRLAEAGLATKVSNEGQDIADGLKEIYFHDIRARAVGLSGVAINDIEYLAGFLIRSPHRAGINYPSSRAGLPYGFDLTVDPAVDPDLCL